MTAEHLHTRPRRLYRCDWRGPAGRCKRKLKGQRICMQHYRIELAQEGLKAVTSA